GRADVGGGGRTRWLADGRVVEALSAVAGSERAELALRLSFLIVTNYCFRICFRLNELNRSTKIMDLVDSVVSSCLGFLDFPLADAVTYHFYLGRLRLLQHDCDA
ncbi:hypothetical protein HK405_001739, partial [Cladochytrium tenue]